MSDTILKQLDILIGLALVLSVTSLFVTLAVQAVVAFLGLRGDNLRWGIATLLRELDPTGALKQKEKDGDRFDHAATIASEVLSDPLVSDSTAFGRVLGKVLGNLGIFSDRWKLASAIRSEELTALLRKSTNPELVKLLGRRDARALVTGLAQQAGMDPTKIPSDMLDQVGRELQPALDLAGSAVSNVDRWFDATMDRVAQRFVTHTRIITVIAAFLTAIVFHLDVTAIYTRLGADDLLRNSMVASVAEAQKVTSGVPLVTAAPGTPAAQTEEQTRHDALEHARSASNQLQQTLSLLGPLGFVPPYELGFSCQTFGKNWKALTNISGLSLVGIILGGLLLSLGAPFWFNALKTLTSLRPILAKRVDETQ